MGHGRSWTEVWMAYIQYLWYDKVKISADFKNHIMRCAMPFVVFGINTKKSFFFLKYLFGCQPKKPFLGKKWQWTPNWWIYSEIISFVQSVPILGARRLHMPLVYLFTIERRVHFLVKKYGFEAAKMNLKWYSVPMMHVLWLRLIKCCYS